LGSQPFGAPLVRGHHSLWLTADDFILFEHDDEIHRIRHHLPVGIGWHLSCNQQTQPLLQAPDERIWNISSFTDQLLHGDVNQRAQLLISANYFQDALTLLAQSADQADRSLAIRARLGLAQQLGQPLPQLDNELDLRGQDGALILSAHFANGDQGRRHLLAGWDKNGSSINHSKLYHEIDRLAQSDPTLLFSTSQAKLIEPSELWDHVFTSAAWREWRQSPDILPFNQPIPQSLAASVAVPANDHLVARRDDDGALRWNQLRYALRRTPDAITIHCTNEQGHLLWHHQWQPYAFLSAPSQHMDIRNGYIYVQEGEARLVVLDALLGVELGVFPRIDTAGIAYFLSPSQLAFIGPLGINTMLTLVDHQGREQLIPLPTPARWSCVIANHIIVRLADERVMMYPGGQQLRWPNDLIDLSSAPLVTKAGLQAGERLWAWP
jgi:hypothetical protein